jgi:hypothetical protein
VHSFRQCQLIFASSSPLARQLSASCAECHKQSRGRGLPRLTDTTRQPSHTLLFENERSQYILTNSSHKHILVIIPLLTVMPGLALFRSNLAFSPKASPTLSQFAKTLPYPSIHARIDAPSNSLALRTRQKSPSINDAGALKLFACSMILFKLKAVSAQPDYFRAILAMLGREKHSSSHSPA